MKTALKTMQRFWLDRIWFDRGDHLRLLLAIGGMAGGWAPLAGAQSPPYCQQSANAIGQKAALRQAAFAGNAEAKQRYDTIVGQQREQLHTCRQQSWPQTEATWIRLYPCDIRPGALEAVLDRMVERGYNAVYVETFAGSKVLLPANNNPTPWASTISPDSSSDVDLLARVIQKGHDRGLKVYAWMFTLNFGADYFYRASQDTIARNGLGKTSLSAAQSNGTSGELSRDGAFVDPYSIRARQDYANLVRAIVQRQPDGLLFDYVRYPLGKGGDSVAGRVQDLWVYGDSSRQVLLQRALNQRGLELIQRYLQQGYITAGDISAVSARFPQEGEPMWQGRNPNGNTAGLPAAKRAEILSNALWQLAVAHAAQGVVDFLNAAIAAKSSGISAGVVFFPDGNRQVGQLGYDSRLQFWENFPRSIDWHPMAYATCGNVGCITAQLQRVLKMAPPGTRVKPVLAGIWQESISNRPPLEAQMQAVYQLAPKLQSVSHFAYSWQEPGSDRDRKYCRF